MQNSSDKMRFFFLFLTFFLFFFIFLFSAVVSHRFVVDLSDISQWISIVAERKFHYVFSLFFLGYVVGSIPFGVLLGKLYRVNLRSQGSGNMGATNAMRVMGKTAGLVVFFLDFLKGFLFCCLILSVFAKIFPEVFTDEKTLGFVAPIFHFLCFAPFFGHIFSLFQRFNGGKGVATFFGVITFLYPVFAFVLLTIFFIPAFLITRTVSFSSLFTGLLYPTIFFLAYQRYDVTKDDNGLILEGIVCGGSRILDNFPQNMSFFQLFLWRCRFYDFLVGTHEYLIVGAMITVVFCVLLIFYRHKENIFRMIRGEEFSFLPKKIQK